jgi:transcriptional regulator with XRE-family HTH domain
VTAPTQAAHASMRSITATDALFAERLKAARQARGWGSRDLSIRLGQHVQFVQTIERGHPHTRSRRRVTIGEAVAICAVLGVDLAQMLDPEVPLETLLGGAE